MTLAAQRIEGMSVEFIDALDTWDRAVPATLVTPAGSLEDRHALLHALASRALAVHPELVEIEHTPDRPPIIAKPLGSRLYLSLASRAGLAALAIAPGRVGTDVESLDMDAGVPWNVLHPEEVKHLMTLSGRPQAMGFTRLWSLKEAYLKALGVGLKREPSSFAVQFLNGEIATVHDPVTPMEVADARTTWRSLSGTWIAVSTVVLSRASAHPR